MATKIDPGAEMTSPNSVDFHYIKGTGFRTIYAEGAYGGITGRGMIQFALYNERSCIPRSSRIEVTETGLGAETITDSREGFIREVEASVLMTLENAASLRDWLTQKIEQFEAMKRAAGEA